MEIINKMYLCYATEMCKIWGIGIFDLYTNDQGRSIARSIPDMMPIDHKKIKSDLQNDQKPIKQKKSRKNATPLLLLLEMVS